MIHRKRVSLYFIILAVIGVSCILYPANAQKIDLTSSQISSLLSLGIKIAIPSYIPPGFVVNEVKIEPCPQEVKRTAKNTCRFGLQYGIIYRNVDNSCFAIEGTGGGIGGVAYEYGFPVETSLFGQVYIRFGKGIDEVKKPSEQQLKIPQNNLSMDWVGDSPFYRLIGAYFIRSTYYGERKSHPFSECKNDITPTEAKKIVESLQWLD